MTVEGTGWELPWLQPVTCCALKADAAVWALFSILDELSGIVTL